MHNRTLLIHRLCALTLMTWLSLGVDTAKAVDNTVLGTGAGASLVPDAHNNTLLGENAGAAITGSDSNTLVGNEAGQNTTGDFNTMVGNTAGTNTTTGDSNAFFGDAAGFHITIGSNNTFLGRAAGGLNQTGSGNVFVGRFAGRNELGSDKLYVANSDISFPLIYGEFNNDLVGINGALGVGTQLPFDRLHVRDGNLRIEQTGATHAILNFIANGQTWEIKNNEATGRLTFFSPGGGATTASFKFDRQAVENLLRVGVLGASIVDINGDLMVTGTFSNPDYVLTPEYDLESIEAHAAYMWEHQHLPAVGAGEVNAQGQAMVNVGQRSQGMLEELEKAHIYIEQLKNESDEKGQQISALTKEMTANETQLAQAHSKIDQLQGEVTALKAKEAQLEGLKREMTALKALVNQLMVQNRAAAPGKES